MEKVEVLVITEGRISIRVTKPLPLRRGAHEEERQYDINNQTMTLEEWSRMVPNWLGMGTEIIVPTDLRAILDPNGFFTQATSA